MTMTNSFKKKKKKNDNCCMRNGKEKKKLRIGTESEKINFQMCKHIQENYKIYSK